MHRKRQFSLLVTLLLLLSLLTSSVAWAQVPAQPAPPLLHLQAASFAPAAGQQPDLPPGLTIAGYNANVRGAYIVQFGAPIEQAWRDQLTALGAEILGYLPDFAYKVRMNPAQASQAATLPGVVWVGVFQPAYKLSPDLKLDGHRLYRIRLERGADAGLVTAAVATSGAELLARNGNVIVVVADAAQLAALAQVSDIAWIENFAFKVKHNESGGGVIMGGNAALAAGFDGSTQIAAVADTGIGGGTASTAHADVPASRIQAIYNWTSPDVRFCYRVRPDGPQDVDSGHGTHVALSVVGDGGGAGEGRGVAPAAKLVFQAVEEYLDIYALCNDPNTPDGYYLIGIPDDLHELFQQAYGAGARTHSNSWGSAQAGVYTLDSQNTDDFIWQTRDMLVTFSAGNEGIDANSDGIIDNDSIGSPATAKNVLTVGASENQRPDSYPCDSGLGYQSHDLYQPGQTCGSMGGQNILGTYGGRWPADYPANPIASDLTAGNQEQMAAFSSRGPTNDGRIKPDIVAPGTWVLSGYSSLYQEGYGDPVNPQNNAYQVDGWGMPLNVAYKYFGGTSMSNPLAGGAAVVVRDFYQKAYGIGASAALVKATLINSAVDLLDENNDGVNDNLYPIPNVHEGWGRINLAAAVDGSHQFVDHTAGLGTNGVATYQYGVAGGAAFKVSLVWSDYASTETANKNLVNDLDLVVTSPSGQVYRGNVFAGGWSQANSGTADRTNNVENVYVPAAEAGVWTVSVSGFNVPFGPQPFALVVDGLGGPPPPTPTPTSTATPTPTPLPTATPTATPTPTSPPAGSVHIGDLDGSTTTAKGNRWNASVTVTVHNNSEATVAGATVSGSWGGAASGGGSCTTGASGTCVIEKNNLRGSSATFTVTSVSASQPYNAAANHDPDGDSNGTSITIVAP